MFWLFWPARTAFIEELLRSFLSELLGGATINDHSLIICQLGIKQGGLGLLHSASRAVSDFVIGMNKACFSARHGFKIWRDSSPIRLHPSLTNLFDYAKNTSSVYLQRFHSLLPHIWLRLHARRRALPPTTLRISSIMFRRQAPHPAYARLAASPYVVTYTVWSQMPNQSNLAC